MIEIPICPSCGSTTTEAYTTPSGLQLGRGKRAFACTSCAWFRVVTDTEET